MRRRRFHPRTYADIIARQDGLCACGCDEPLGTDPRDIEYDHAVPLWNGGEDTPENLRALKKKHHFDKTRRETRARAKMKRIAGRDGLRRRKLSRHDRMLGDYLVEG